MPLAPVNRRLVLGLMVIGNAIALYLRWANGGWLNHLDGSVRVHDFLAFWAAGKQAVAGNASVVYDAATQTAFQTRLINAPNPVLLPLFYPPHFLFTTVAFASLGLLQAYILFLAVTVSLYVVALRIFVCDWAEAALAALAGGGAYVCLLWVQNGFLTGALLVAGLALLPARPRIAGILFGLLTIKPQLGLLIPIALAAGGYWRAFGWAAGTFALSAVAAEFAFGPGIWAAFVQSTVNAGTFLQAGAIWFKMQTPFALTLRLFGPIGAYAVQAVIALTMAFIVYRLWRNEAISHWLKSSALIAASLLVSPYLFAYDAVPLTGAALLLLRENPDLPSGDQVALLAACLLPGLNPYLFSAAVPVAALTMMVIVLRECDRQRSFKGTTTEPAF